MHRRSRGWARSSIYKVYALAILSALLLVISIITLASKASSVKLLDDEIGHNARSIQTLSIEFPGENVLLAPYPKHLAPSLTGLVLTTASFCLVTAVCLIAAILRIFRQKEPIKLARSQWLILLSLFAAVEILAVTTMITMIVKAAQSARFSRRTLKEDLETSDKYESQIFELGTWACETEDLPSFVGSYSLAAQCGLSTTLRVSIVLQLILISLSFAIVWWDKSGNRNLFAEPRYMPDEDGDSDVELE